MSESIYGTIWDVLENRGEANVEAAKAEIDKLIRVAKSFQSDLLRGWDVVESRFRYRPAAPDARADKFAVVKSIEDAIRLNGSRSLDLYFAIGFDEKGGKPRYLVDFEVHIESVVAEAYRLRTEANRESQPWTGRNFINAFGVRVIEFLRVVAPSLPARAEDVPLIRYE